MKDEDSFSKQIDDVLSGKYNRFDALRVCDTPQIFLAVGLQQLPILYTQNHLKDALHEKSSGNPHWHGLSIEQIKKVPKLLETPVLLMDSLNNDDSVVAVLPILDNDNAPVFATIKPNGNGIYNSRKTDSNFMLSIYGKEKGFEYYIKRAVQEDKILYWNKEKSQEIQCAELLMAQGLDSLDSEKILHQTTSLVNKTTSTLVIDSNQAARIKAAREIKENMPNLSENERTAAIAILEAGAKSQGMEFSEYVEKTFPDGIFGDIKKAENAAKQQGVNINGAVSVNGFGENVKAVIYAGKTADFSTWCHELSHIWQAQLAGELKNDAEEAFQVKDSDWQNSIYTFKDGHTDTSAEAFAYGFEDFLKNKAGEMAAEDKKKIFEKFADYMSRTYNGVKQHIEINKKIASVYQKFVELDDNILAQAEKAVQMENTFGKELFEKIKNKQELSFSESQKLYQNIVDLSEEFGNQAPSEKEVLEKLRSMVGEIYATSTDGKSLRIPQGRDKLSHIFKGDNYKRDFRKKRELNRKLAYNAEKIIGNALFTEAELPKPEKNKDYLLGMHNYEVPVFVNGHGFLVRLEGEVIKKLPTSAPGSIPVQKNTSIESNIDNNELLLKLQATEVSNLYVIRKQKMLFQTAYHGSGANFDKFNISEYGMSGEGSMAFGYGVYVSNSESIAKSYAGRQGERNLYTVEIPDGNYISWEKTVSKTQKENVKNELYKKLIEEDYKGAEKEIFTELNAVFGDELDGKYLYGTISSYIGSDKETSRFFKNIGYSGIQYPAGTPENAVNYVIFDDNDIKIKNHFQFQIIGELGARELDRNAESNERIANLETAKRMEEAEKDANAIRLATGWEKGADGKWKYEIDDSKVHFNLYDAMEEWDEMHPRYEELREKFFKTELSEEERKEFDQWVDERNEVSDKHTDMDFSEKLLGKTFRLPEVMRHNELFKAYPELKYVTVSIKKTGENGTLGNASYEDKHINLYRHEKDTDGFEEWEKKAGSVLLHEVQHIIQGIEGFAKGASPEMFEESPEASEQSSIGRKIVADGKSFMSAMEAYRASAGEVESRNVQTRMRFTPKQRINTLLSDTADIAPKDQIVMFDVPTSESRDIKNTNEERSVALKADASDFQQIEPALQKKFDKLKAAIKSREEQDIQDISAAEEPGNKKQAIRSKSDIIRQAGKDFLKSVKEGIAPFFNAEDDFQRIIMHPQAIINASNGLPFSGESQLLAQIYHQRQRMEGEVVTSIAGAKAAGTIVLDTPESRQKNFALTDTSSLAEKNAIVRTRYFMPESCEEPDKIYAHTLQRQRPDKIRSYRDLIRHFENIPNGQKEISDIRIRIAHEHLKEIQSRFAIKEKRVLSVDEIEERKNFLRNYFERLPADYRNSEKSAFEDTFGIQLNSEKNLEINLQRDFKDIDFAELKKNTKKSIELENRKLSDFIEKNTMEDKKLATLLSDEYKSLSKEEKMTVRNLKIEAIGIKEPETFLGKYLAACNTNAEFITDKETVEEVKKNLVKKLEENFKLEKYDILKEIGQQAQSIGNETTKKISFEKAHSNNKSLEKTQSPDKEISLIGMGK